MITFMSDILCVTNRSLCRGDFLEKIGQIADARPRAIILREKELGKTEYEDLACEFIKVCEARGTKPVLHSYPEVARRLGADALHMPLPGLREMAESDRLAFGILGASCHSVEDALEAEALGCTYITAGHVFETDCKKDLEPRGIDFLRSVCDVSDIPVYAIGGINPENISEVRAAGASGACLMSGFMQTGNVKGFMKALET